MPRHNSESTNYQESKCRHLSTHTLFFLGGHYIPTRDISQEICHDLTPFGYNILLLQYKNYLPWKTTQDSLTEYTNISSINTIRYLPDFMSQSYSNPLIFYPPPFLFIQKFFESITKLSNLFFSTSVVGLLLKNLLRLVSSTTSTTSSINPTSCV